jgi:hypothetical protein
MSGDELKKIVYDILASLEFGRVEMFVLSLDERLRARGFNLRDYLLPIGVAGRHVSQLTPYELSHLARFFHLHVPRGKQAFEAALRETTGHTFTSTPVGPGRDIRTGRRAARPHIRRA